MSATASFVDPVFLANFGLSRVNVLDYFLLRLNPFRTSASTSNEVLDMQGISIGMFMQYGTNGFPMPPQTAEEEYSKALSRLQGEQYELMAPVNPEFYVMPSPLYTIRHVKRTNPTTVKVLGIYYVVEGVIYKAPSVRSLMKTNVARTLEGLSGACSALSVCARYLPSTGYTWNFDDHGKDPLDSEDNKDVDPIALMKLTKRTKRRKILDNRPAGERNEAEEEGLRASHAIDQILVRLTKSPLVSSNAIRSSGGGIGSGGATGAGSAQKIAVAEPSSAAASVASAASSNNNANDNHDNNNSAIPVEVPK